ncbi:hypothetical protein Fcan01_16259 [Folsomia candida]|uniref:Uncharacterized protein n=1 Tax=Folsomia candida TaxID=158441 RepID=A0A226DTT6_FOLCA|nr:hypothetical protein Fcan01_16259 [Folsomia candida]
MDEDTPTPTVFKPTFQFAPFVHRRENGNPVARSRQKFPIAPDTFNSQEMPVVKAAPPFNHEEITTNIFSHQQPADAKPATKPNYTQIRTVTSFIPQSQLQIPTANPINPVELQISPVNSAILVNHPKVLAANPLNHAPIPAINFTGAPRNHPHISTTPLFNSTTPNPANLLNCPEIPTPSQFNYQQIFPPAAPSPDAHEQEKTLLYSQIQRLKHRHHQTLSNLAGCDDTSVILPNPTCIKSHTTEKFRQRHTQETERGTEEIFHTRYTTLQLNHVVKEIDKFKLGTKKTYEKICEEYEAKLLLELEQIENIQLSVVQSYDERLKTRLIELIVTSSLSPFDPAVRFSLIQECEKLKGDAKSEFKSKAVNCTFDLDQFDVGGANIQNIYDLLQSSLSERVENVQNTIDALHEIHSQNFCEQAEALQNRFPNDLEDTAEFSRALEEILQTVKTQYAEECPNIGKTQFLSDFKSMKNHLQELKNGYELQFSIHLSQLIGKLGADEESIIEMYECLIYRICRIYRI